MSEEFPTNPAADQDLVPPNSVPRGMPVGNAPRDSIVVDIPRRNDGDPDPTMYPEPEPGSDFDETDYVEEGTDPVTGLTNEERQDMVMLMTVGKRRGFFSVLGHRIDCETLNAWDEMNVGRYVKPYIDTPGYMRAYTVATAAAGIREVDGKPVFQALAPVENESELFDQKVKIMAQHYPFTITPIYDFIQQLDGEFAELAERLGKVYG